MATGTKTPTLRPGLNARPAVDWMIKRLAWLFSAGRWEKVALAGLIVLLPVLFFYNLGLNPRSWHDEGAALSVPKTLVQYGVYATRSSEGFQTFGPAQSVGPTVLLPVALMFKLFGVGLVQARVIASIYALTALALIYVIGRKWFNRRAAIFALMLVISYPAGSFFLYGRQVLGDIPGLTLFLAGILAWWQGLNTGRKGFSVLAGLLLGLSMVTKSHNLIIGGAVLGVMILLDWFYYKQKNWVQLIIIGVIAAGMFAAWQGFQYFYYGPAVFAENMGKLSQLAKSSTGLNLRLTFSAFRHLTGAGSGYLYLYWGFPALLYAGYLALRKDKQGFGLAFLWLSCIFWLAYYALWIIPWPPYAVAPSAVTAIFVGKLVSDLVGGLERAWKEAPEPLFRGKSEPGQFNGRELTILGSGLGLLVLALFTGYSFYNIVTADVLDKFGAEESQLRSPRQFEVPYQIAAYLNTNVADGEIIDTWERELGILTDRTYHFPDQSLLIYTHAANYRGGARNYSVGAEYFQKYNVNYVVAGWWARSTQIYDMDFLQKNATLVATFGAGDWRYELYRLKNR